MPCFSLHDLFGLLAPSMIVYLKSAILHCSDISDNHLLLHLFNTTELMFNTT